ncbi:MAG: hypothetical protein DMG05_23540 [Acidobacteria bacterium]|nr:MAG: hypothetical protein DMG05_23540 [Acidobacteriota bacterium]
MHYAADLINRPDATRISVAGELSVSLHNRTSEQPQTAQYYGFTGHQPLTWPAATLSPEGEGENGALVVRPK